MKRPNFLFIMTDTQATNMVGCYSGKPLNTSPEPGLKIATLAWSPNSLLLGARLQHSDGRV